MRRYDIVLLDADNTLFDFNAAEARALDAVLAEFGWPRDEETKRTYLEINHALWSAFDRGEAEEGFLTVERFRLLGERLGRSADPAEMNRRYLDHLGECSLLLPGAEELLQTLAAQYALYLVSNGTAAVQAGRIASAGIAPYFREIFISEQMGLHKPQKEFFNACFAAIPGFHREEALIIGDSLTSDIRGGNNAGIRTCWFNPQGKPRPADVHVDYEVSALPQIPPLLEGLG